MGRASKAQSVETAATIVRAARKLFAQNGYGAVRLEEVAVEAGVTRGAVYHHFDSKHDLFAAAHTAVQTDVGHAVARATDGISDLWMSLELGCQAFLRASVGEDSRQILLRDGPAILGWQLWRAEDAKNSARHLDEILTELADAEIITVSSVQATSALLSGAMNEAAMWMSESAAPGDAFDDVWPELSRMLTALRS